MINSRTAAYVYCLVSPNGKVYVGQTRDIYTRWNRYKNGHCKTQQKLFRSLNKYGYSNHKSMILIELPYEIEQEVLDNFECLAINYFRNNGVELLNLKEGGSKGLHSEETKAKMSAQRVGISKGRKFSDEIRKKMSLSRIGEKNHNFGKPKTPEIKAKMREAHLGQKWSDERKKKLSETKKVTMLGKDNHFYGRKHSAESIEKMKLAHKNNWRLKKQNQQNAIEI